MKLEQAYIVLGVSHEASESQVKSAYKKAALLTHPDKNPNDPDAHKKFLEVSQAYKRITDPSVLENDDDGGGEGEFEGFPFGDEEEMFNLFNMMMADMLFGIGGKRGGKASFMSASMSGSQYFEEHEMSDDDFDDDDSDDAEEDEIDLAEIQRLLGHFSTGDSRRSFPSAAPRSSSTASKLDKQSTSKRGARSDAEGFSMEALMAAMFEEEMFPRQSKPSRSRVKTSPLKKNMKKKARAVDDEDDGDVLRSLSADLNNAKIKKGTIPVAIPVTTSAATSAATRATSGAKDAKVNPQPASSSGSAVSLGDVVSVAGQPGLVGRVAFVGEVHYSKGVFCGVIVTGSGGKNNGTIKGHKYFTCAEKKGLMVKLDEVRRV